MGTAKHREWRRLGMFEEALRDWEGGCFLTCGQASYVVTQDQAAALLGVSTRTFRRWVVRHGEDGIVGIAGPSGVAGLAPCGAGGRGDADGGPLPDAARGLERASLLRLVSAPWPGVMLHQSLPPSPDQSLPPA